VVEGYFPQHPCRSRNSRPIFARRGAGMTNTLYYGDNLEVLREHIADASVDLIYLEEDAQGSLP